MTPLISADLPIFPEALKSARTAQPFRDLGSASVVRDLRNDAVEQELQRLRQASQGERNQALNRAAYQIGKLAPSSRPSDDNVRASLLEACEDIGLLADDGEDACLKTIMSGLTSGASARTDTLASVLTSIQSSVFRSQEALQQSSSSLRVIPEAECGRGERAPYVIKSFIARGDFVCVFGPPGSGKSVLVPFLSQMIALGEPLYKLKTRTGPVLYVAAEDASGLGTRIRALVNRYGKSDQLYLVDGLTDLGSEDGTQLKELAQIVREKSPSLVVLDTLAMSFPGLDENSSEAMSKVVSISRALTKLDCAVLLIHHDTKSAGGTPRGHSILNGALDVALQLKPADSRGVVRGQLTKNRNGSPDAVSVAFRIESETIGRDEDGDPITAPVLVEDAHAELPNERLTKSEQAALTELDVLLPVQWEPDDPIPSVALSDWRKACDDGFNVSGSEKRESRSKAFNRALSSLSKKGRIVIEDGMVRLPLPNGEKDEA